MTSAGITLSHAREVVLSGTNRVTCEPGEKAYRFYRASWETCDEGGAHCEKRTQPQPRSAPPHPSEQSRNSTRLYLCWDHHLVASRVSRMDEDGASGTGGGDAVATRLPSNVHEQLRGSTSSRTLT
jgi:hypothetical protein